VRQEIEKRCPFAIISHPDAGKTTLTEQILWYGNVIRETGKVKSKQGKFATSDWMDLEKERGISVSSTVLSFEYKHRLMHLLDTPGHKDFSEDTYRTLTAVESALMAIDAAKGVEAQTIKLMEVCRLRQTPIVSFINKMDRDSLSPLALLEQIEEVLKIQCLPFSWPLKGKGGIFKGVYDLRAKKILPFTKGQSHHEEGEGEGKGKKEEQTFLEYPDPLKPTQEVLEFLGEEGVKSFQEDWDLLQDTFPELELELFLQGKQTPVFFGSALYQFGVKEVLSFIADHCPGPSSKKAIDLVTSQEVEISPYEEEFSGVVFKIQANMDPKHRDRIAFIRVCSGSFVKGQKLFSCREKKEVRFQSPLFFQARERTVSEESYAGDIIGIHDTGKLQIGDTFTEKRPLKFLGIPHFAPELFQYVQLLDPLKSKQLDKGLEQLSEEGAVQVFFGIGGRKILGAIGALQFEVIKYRLFHEYGVKADYVSCPLQGIRWIIFKPECSLSKQEEFRKAYGSFLVSDGKKRMVFSYTSPWDLKLAQEKFPQVEFLATAEGLSYG